jgi:hypothetical protein
LAVVRKALAELERFFLELQKVLFDADSSVRGQPAAMQRREPSGDVIGVCRAIGLIEDARERLAFNAELPDGLDSGVVGERTRDFERLRIVEAGVPQAEHAGVDFTALVVLVGFRVQDEAPVGRGARGL